MSTSAQANLIRHQVRSMCRSTAPSRCSRRASARSSRASTTCSRSRSPRRCSSLAPAGGCSTAGSTAASASWGRVLAFEPPDRVVISWDISPRWQVETDLDKTSEVEVRFIAEAPDRTRVELEHRHLDRHLDGWQGLREGMTPATGAGRLPPPLRGRGRRSLTSARGHSGPPRRRPAPAALDPAQHRRVDDQLPEGAIAAMWAEPSPAVRRDQDGHPPAVATRPVRHPADAQDAVHGRIGDLPLLIGGHFMAADHGARNRTEVLEPATTRRLA